MMTLHGILTLAGFALVAAMLVIAFRICRYGKTARRVRAHAILCWMVGGFDVLQMFTDKLHVAWVYVVCAVIWAYVGWRGFKESRALQMRELGGAAL